MQQESNKLRQYVNPNPTTTIEGRKNITVPNRGFEPRSPCEMLPLHQGLLRDVNLQQHHPTTPQPWRPSRAYRNVRRFNRVYPSVHKLNELQLIHSSTTCSSLAKMGMFWLGAWCNRVMRNHAIARDRIVNTIARARCGNAVPTLLRDACCLNSQIWIWYRKSTSVKREMYVAALV